MRCVQCGASRATGRSGRGLSAKRAASSPRRRSRGPRDDRRREALYRLLRRMAEQSVSRILEDVREGRADLAKDLFPVVYRELRAIADHRLRALPPGQTLQPTALVHEAFIALVDQGTSLQSRAHFFGVASMAMRDILVDAARKKRALKRGGGERPVEFDEQNVTRAIDSDAVDVIALSDAMDRLRSEYPRQAEVAMLRAFAGLQESEIAEIHGVTTRTIERDWRFAQAFLRRELAR